MHVFQTKNWCSPKSDQFIFSLTWLSEDLYIRRILNEKKYGVQGQFREKTEALYEGLNEKAEAVIRNYFVTGDFLQYIYYVLVIKNHQKIRSRGV